MKKNSIRAAAIALIASFAMTSCIGSFSLTNKVLDWNQSLGDKFVNEVVFIGLNILLVYEFTVAADALVLNTVEFWTGSNPVADANIIKEVKGSDGMMYTIKTLEDGYEITNANGEVMNFIHNEDDDSWSVESNGETVKLFCYNGNGTVDANIGNGETMTISLNQDGLLAYGAAVEGNSCLAMN